MSNDTWTPERIELVKRSICPKGISDDAFALFVEQCKRSGLDPLLKQAFCVERRQNIGNKERPNWVNKHEFQPAEAGMLARAEQFPGFEGITAAEVYAEDPIIIDYGVGTVEHRVNPAQRKGVLVGAWARVQRAGKVPLVVWVDFAAVNQPTPLWGKMPAVMCRKCARVAALRTAYPEAFGGMYVAGERPDDVDTGEDVEVPAAVTREKPALPEPAPRETLTFSTAREKAPVCMETAHAEPTTERVPGSDDDEPDALERESAAIAAAAGTATTQEQLKALKARAVALPKESPEFKTAARALTEAFGRISRSAA
jgi:phage recombination protein Bet